MVQWFLNQNLLIQNNLKPDWYKSIWYWTDQLIDFKQLLNFFANVRNVQFYSLIFLSWNLLFIICLQLNFPGISVSDVQILTPGQQANVLKTHWSKSDVDLSRGLDFTPRGSIFARLTHLNHEAFTYSIIVHNSNNQEKIGTVRIFMAPKTDRLGRAYKFDDQKNLMVEMDRFTTNRENFVAIYNKKINWNEWFCYLKFNISPIRGSCGLKNIRN